MARATPGNYVPLDVNYPRDPAIRAAGEAAELLYVRGLAYCKSARTDGLVPSYDLDVVAIGLRGVPKRVAALVSHGLWRPVDGGWLVRSWGKWNKPSQVEDAFVAGQAEHGNRGNHERWHVGRGVTDRTCPHCIDPNRLPDRVADPRPESPIREGKGREEPPTPSAGASGFDEFWELYPRKTAKRAADKAWRAAVKRAQSATILAGLRRATFRDDPQFVPHPATWLNQDRWTDEPTAAPNTVDGSLTAAQIDDVLGADSWQLPQSPFDPAEQWSEHQAWLQQARDEHRADRVRRARAELERRVLT